MNDEIGGVISGEQGEKAVPSVGTGLAPVREMVARVNRTGHSVPFTPLRTGASPVPTRILLS